MHAMPARAWLVVGGLALLPASAALAQNPAGQPDAAALIERLREIEGELAPDARAPEMTEQEVRTLLRERLGVEILRVEVVELDGEPAYAVTVMMPPGNRNNALMAATLLVDGATGAVLGQESTAPRTPAPHLPTTTGRYVPEGGGRDIRRRTWR